MTTIYKFATIENYTDACRETFLNSNKGFSNLLIKQDASGRAIDVRDEGTIVGGSDDRKIVLPLDTPQDYLVTQDIKHIEGDSTSLTITNADDTTAVVP